VVGTRPIRHDGTDKVTGRARYGSDIKLSGLLHGYILRSPHAHARIISIDTTRAASVPGVHAVCTNADMPSATHRAGDLGEGIVDWYHLNQNVLAADKVLYTGHAVAAVAADSVHIAEEAARLIEVEYEPLHAYLDPNEALVRHDPAIHPDNKKGNISKHVELSFGEVDEALARAEAGELVLIEDAITGLDREIAQRSWSLGPDRLDPFTYGSAPRPLLSAELDVPLSANTRGYHVALRYEGRLIFTSDWDALRVTLAPSLRYLAMPRLPSSPPVAGGRPSPARRPLRGLIPRSTLRKSLS
jgi:hypothetical protein